MDTQSKLLLNVVLSFVALFLGIYTTFCVEDTSQKFLFVCTAQLIVIFSCLYGPSANNIIRLSRQVIAAVAVLLFFFSVGGYFLSIN